MKTNRRPQRPTYSRKHWIEKKKIQHEGCAGLSRFGLEVAWSTFACVCLAEAVRINYACAHLLISNMILAFVCLSSTGCTFSANSGCMHGLHCASSLQLCVMCSLSVCVNAVWVIAEGCLCVEGECSGAPSLLKRSCVTGLDGRVGRGHILGFSCSGRPDKGSALAGYCLQKPPRGRCERAECVCVCYFCVMCVQICRLSGQFCSNEKTCLLAGDQRLKLDSSQRASFAFFFCCCTLLI